MKNKHLSILCTLSLITFAFLSSVNYWSFNKNFYKNEYKKLGVTEYIGISEDDLKKTTDVLLGYIKGNNKTLDIECRINGITRSVFNDREKAHMQDVKNLYDGAIVVRNVSFVIFVLSFIYIGRSKELFIGYKYSLSLVGLIIAFLLLFCLMDFEGFWLAFHQLFFPFNDLYILDPRYDILVMMVPEGFFFDLCVLIVASTSVMLVGLYFVLRKFLND
ncbi:MAG: TIGR01906 family membrane protein [Solobacterium sp.]|nr:TIGR01906 family membrane protein [Solobacterium sp.]MCI7157065.1 TIGR01906 family membrane protein [Solobacterium sp.]MDD7776136.1 TIGR01906 family membrane protein [Solobacterium sp.]MDY2953562.1 TIGR01906 family membrane protein [Erysipelotrichaceae bacterium]MDY5401172.1 TIGR01906 family membrane protein [Erysipelotrichaceae bacterium]